VDCNKGGHGCLICHPLEVEGCGCIGAIEVLREAKEEYTPLEMKLLKLYAVKVAATLGVQQLHHSSEMYRTQCSTLAEVWSGTVEPNESISRLVANTRKVVGGDFTLYYQKDSTGRPGEALKLAWAEMGAEHASMVVPQRVPWTGCAIGHVASSGDCIMGAPSEVEFFCPEHDAPPGAILECMLAVPVKHPDQTVIGVLYTGKVANEKAPSSFAFMEEDLHKVWVLCGLLAQLTAWSLLQADMLKIEDQCTRLSDLVSFLCNTSIKKDNEQQLLEMLKLAKEAVGAEVAMLHVAQGPVPAQDEGMEPSLVMKRCDVCVVSRAISQDDDDPTPGVLNGDVETVSRYVDNKIHVPPLSPVGAGMIGACITSTTMQSTVLIEEPDGTVSDPNGVLDLACDMPHAPGFVPKPMAVLAIPIVSQEDQPLGALTVLNKQHSVGPFTVEDSTLLNILATSLAACIVADQLEKSQADASDE